MDHVHPAMLIRNADVWRLGQADVRLQDGRIAATGAIGPQPGERVIDAHGGALLPGLHDHHIHLAALAVAQASVPCGPPVVSDRMELAAALAAPGRGWLRGIGYHESVAGLLDRTMLDQWIADRPVRIQHRSGRMWFLNSMALDLLLGAAEPPPGLDRQTGRLFDEDRWLRQALPSVPPAFATVSTQLAAMGVTGLTDMSAANDGAMAAHFAAEQAAGRLKQKVLLAGTLALNDAHFGPQLTLGPVKLHLHENALPDLDATIAFLRAGHEQGRAAAIHCTTETELVFALAALEAAAPAPGDRIEHAGVTPDHLLAEMARLGLHAVSQPHFIAERGDQYLRDVEPRDQPFLYRLAAFRRAGLVLAAGSDAPYGSHDPWFAMRAALSRATLAGHVMGADEALVPEEALALFLADPLDLRTERGIRPGAAADLCLLDRPWAEARTRLQASDVRMTMIDGSIVHEAVDQAPA